ncbi:MAG: hypothetical protein R3360_04155, partial [Alphaproteobacteria bacterium]|nr:hypothetical protein [Alphaproteobacteria bacterium]
MSTAAEQNSDAPEINLFDPDVLKDPWDAYKTLRDDAPVYFVPQMGLHVVTRYDLVMEAVKDVETYSSQFDQFLRQAQMKWLEGAPESVQQEFREITKDQIIPPATMLTADPPKHTKYRSLVNRVFTAGQVRKMEDFVEQIISDQL